MVICGYLLGYHRARAAADLAALSGAVAYQQGRDGCAEARRLASANGARLADCDEVGDQVDFVITVRVTVAVGLRVPGLPRTITAEAHAGPVAQPARRQCLLVTLVTSPRVPGANSPRDHRVS